VRSPSCTPPPPEEPPGSSPRTIAPNVTFCSTVRFLVITSQAHHIHVSALSGRIARTRIRPVIRHHHWRKQSSHVGFLSPFVAPSGCDWPVRDAIFCWP